MSRLADDAGVAARMARRLLRSRLRGRTRLTLLLSQRIESLHAVPCDTKDGRLYLDLRIGSCHGLLAFDRFEHDEQEIMRRRLRPGDVAYDIGAHFGVHTLLMSKLVGPKGLVVAFEPNPEVCSNLGQTLGELQNATLLSVALADVEGEGILYVPPDASMSSLADWTGERAARIACRKRTLAGLVEEMHLRPPNFIKCDVEGGELDVFRGAGGLLDCEQAPIVLFEANVHNSRGFGLGVDTASGFLQSLRTPRYQLYQIASGGGLAWVPAPTAAHANLLAVPRSRRDELEE